MDINDFLFAQDPVDQGDKNNNNDKEEQEFHCEYCGSTDYYEDSGKLTCSSCFTQSQILSQSRDTNMEHEDIMNAAAKSKGGGIRQVRTVIGGPRKKRGRQPLEELDQSKPLPELSLFCVIFEL